jgi:uncharacterized protein YjbI with pentapeptide repeats
MRWREWLGVGERRWKKAPDEEVQPAKTLWDLLQLLIVPVILVGVSLWWSASQDTRDKRRADQVRQDTTLNDYIDQMSELMLNQSLLSSKRGDAVRSVSRTVTLTTLRRLDGSRKGEVVLFLQEAGLIRNRTPVEGGTVVDLEGADLTEADLSITDLTDANLVGAHLTGADLIDTDLTDADLAGADLTGADLKYAILIDTDLTNTYLEDAELVGADLRRADLTRARLHNADLKDANLRDANLTQASADANLEGANLEGANIERTYLEYANLKGAKNLDLDRFITGLRLVYKATFLDSEKEFLDSLSRDELAQFNLSPEKLARFRREANGAP